MPFPSAWMLPNSAYVTATSYGLGSDYAPTRLESIPIAGTFACSIQPDSSTESIEYERETGRRTFIMYAPMTTDAGSALSIPHDSHIIAGGKTYRVRGPARDVGGRGQMQTVALELED